MESGRGRGLERAFSCGAVTQGLLWSQRTWWQLLHDLHGAECSPPGALWCVGLRIVCTPARWRSSEELRLEGLKPTDLLCPFHAVLSVSAHRAAHLSC